MSVTDSAETVARRTARRSRLNRGGQERPVRGTTPDAVFTAPYDPSAIYYRYDDGTPGQPTPGMPPPADFDDEPRLTRTHPDDTPTRHP